MSKFKCYLIVSSLASIGSCSFILGLPLLIEKGIRNTDILVNNFHGENFENEYYSSVKWIIIIAAHLGVFSALSSLIQSCLNNKISN